MFPSLPGQCSPETNTANDANAKIAYRDVIVRITAKDDFTRRITIAAQSLDGGERTLTISWDDESVVWPYCPSSLPSRAVYRNPGPLPEVGSRGALFLAQTFINTARIVGGGTKFPNRLPGFPLVSLLPVTPTSLVLTADELAENGQVVSGQVNLLDRLKAPPQTLVLGDGTLGVWLTQKGFNEFHVVFPAAAHLTAAVQIILDKKDPAQIAEAWGIVAACKDLIDADKWEAMTAEAPGSPKVDDARKLIDKILTP